MICTIEKNKRPNLNMNTYEQLDLNNDEQYRQEIFQTFDDNGDWEYTRLGLGEDHIGLYLVDLDDTGDQFREKLYVNDTFSASDVINEGLALGVFVKDDEGDIRYNMDEVDNWALLLERVSR